MRLRSIGWLLMMLSATMIAVIASRYFQLDPSTYFEEQKSVYTTRELTLILHVSGALIALLVGPWQFVSRLRRRSILLHRATGAVYSAGCAVGGVAGIAFATTAYGGAVAVAGFTVLGGLWLATTSLALASIYRSDVANHWKWMVLSYSLCFAAVTLRLYVGGYEAIAGADAALGITFENAYVAIAWLCWVPNLAVAYILTRRLSPPSVA